MSRTNNTIDIEEYTSLKKKVELAQQKADKAAGALEQLVRQLKVEFGCNTLEEAEKKLKLMSKQEQISKEEYEKALQKFKDNWDDKLNGDAEEGQ